ncbi:hypothetical protein AWG50_10275 [Escherichia coli]|jgi:hypothetical protein|nr:hypothetical protein [Escherichia coli]DAZ29710.1 MAG TPA: hypothetical protein [Caudoviricetes sp.]EGD5995106.1 hypothetical protein [Escherichia coli]EGE2449314.1 hypothetical protein [Escherichia coli]KZH97328.1 hypothetical protein AWG50_10275 [Escherichia coli]
MKSNRKRMIRAYDKALIEFNELSRSKRRRRQFARLLFHVWHDADFFFDARHITQEDADNIAYDNIYYILRRWEYANNH